MVRSIFQQILNGPCYCLLVVFFPLVLKFALGGFEVCHALSYFFAFEEPVFGFRQIWPYERFGWFNWRREVSIRTGLAAVTLCANTNVSLIKRSRSKPSIMVEYKGRNIATSLSCSFMWDKGSSSQRWRIWKQNTGTLRVFRAILKRAPDSGSEAQCQRRSFPPWAVRQ